MIVFTDIDDTDDNKILVTVADEDNTGNNFLEEIPVDYGDAPDSLAGSVSAADNLANNDNDIPDYLTTFNEDGPRHAIAEDTPVTIGTEVDSDDGTQQNATATADDSDADGNDADGVFLEDTYTSLDGQDAVATEGGKYGLDVIVHDGVTPLPTLPTGIAATVNGTVYNDYDNNGTQEINNKASEVGLEGITVTAYNNAGNVVGTATTNASGAYTLDNPDGESLRIEFTDLPEGYFASAGSGSNVIFYRWHNSQ